MSLVKFRIGYYTNFGEEVCLCGSIPELGNLDEAAALTLSCGDDGIWFAEIETEITGRIVYFYLIRQNGITVRREWTTQRELYLVKSKNFSIRDSWKDKPRQGYFYSSVFTESIFRHKMVRCVPEYAAGSILLRVACPFVRKGQRLVVSGESEQLGVWDLRRARCLDFVGNGEWQILLDAAIPVDKRQYKFVVLNGDTCDAVCWEEGANRLLPMPEADENSVSIETGLEFRCRSFLFKGVGTAVPVFSLRSDESFGIGDFLDLKKMVDWIAVTNQQLIQILPVNDTSATQTWRDSYPYSVVSCYALHPIYLGVTGFPLKNGAQMSSFLGEAEELNRLPQLDYEKVLSLKKRYTEQLFEQEKEQIEASEPYRDFCEKNRFWLLPYTAYCYLRDTFGTSHFLDWGEFSIYNEEKLLQLIRKKPEAKKATDYYSFLQYLLDRQLREVREYARKKGVVLKGDVPIGINRNSVEAWTSPHLFNMGTQTGAPPDEFSVFGQNWGFPTYNWAAMESEGYAWWKNRFRKMADYFDAYRIDHILGFFRIWEIPLHSIQGLLGYFSPALPYTVEELNAAGIGFDEERMTKPFIYEGFLCDLFGEYAGEVREEYLEELGCQRFSLKEGWDTQRKIRDCFADKTDEKNRKIRDGLYALCNEVLFVRDRFCNDCFHPRIAAQYTRSFQCLEDNAKRAFLRLYDHFYYHRHNRFWYEQAMKKLPELISSTSMLVCGEDLGMVPDCVPSVMNELEILSLEIERMPKKPNCLFSDLDSLPYLSVCTTSTHDMSPIRLWWKENRDLTRKYYNEVLRREGEAPEECSSELCRQIIQKHLDSPAMWVILPWQDWMSISEELSRRNPADERINVPSDCNHYWDYRMHCSLDDLLKQEHLNAEIREMSGR